MKNAAILSHIFRPVPPANPPRSDLVFALTEPLALPRDAALLVARKIVVDVEQPEPLNDLVEGNGPLATLLNCLRCLFTVLYESPVSQLIRHRKNPCTFISAKGGTHRSKPEGLSSTFPFLLARSSPAFVLSKNLNASCCVY